MSPIVGVELTPSEVRAVALSRFGGVRRTASAPWDPAHPAAGIAALRATLGAARGVSVAIGVGLLEVKRLHLPPVRHAERARMVALEPDRYFAGIRGAAATAFDDASQTGFAVPKEALEEWIRALEEWGPVERVEPTPIALSRVVAASGEFALGREGEDRGIVEFRSGRLASVRRLPSTMGLNGARPLPALPSVSADFAAAFGAARGREDSLAGVLATPELSRTLSTRRRSRLALFTTVAAGALLFLGWSLTQYQERTIAALEAESVRLAAEAGPALLAQQQLLSFVAESQALTQLASSRTDHLSVFATVSAILPDDAVILSVRARGDEWEIDGTARDASALVPLFDKAGVFENVRARAATTRFQDGSRARETFALAFRARRTP